MVRIDLLTGWYLRKTGLGDEADQVGKLMLKQVDLNVKLSSPLGRGWGGFLLWCFVLSATYINTPEMVREDSNHGVVMRDSW